MKLLKAFFLCFLLCACGPRDIGQGMAEPEASAGAGGATTAELMRYPLTGANNTQKLLYYTNRPDVMESVQKWRVKEFQQRLGIQPEDPEYRAVPKQRSPFRQ